MIETKSVDIMFEQTFDEIEQFYQMYVTPQFYECINVTNKTNDNFSLLLTTGSLTVAVEAES